MTSASCNRARLSLFIPSPPMLTVQQKCHVNPVSARGQVEVLNKCSFPLSGIPALRASTATRGAGIWRSIYISRCEGKRSDQCFGLHGGITPDVHCTFQISFHTVS